MEGPQCFGTAECDQQGLTLPVASYGRDQGSTVTGGYVYRGTRQPLPGIYLFADFGSGRIWGLPAADAAGGHPTVTQLAESPLHIASFGEDEAGELYLVDLAGSVVRLTATTR